MKAAFASEGNGIPAELFKILKDARDGMGREVGRGFRIGNTCTPMADSC